MANRSRLGGLVTDKSDNHAVEVEEEHDEVEAELEERFLDFYVSLRTPTEEGEDRFLTFLWTFSFRKISVASRKWVLLMILLERQLARRTRLAW